MWPFNRWNKNQDKTQKPEPSIFAYILTFEDQKTGKLYEAVFPYNKPYKCEFVDDVKTLVSIELVSLTGFEEKNYFKYFDKPDSNIL